MTTSRQHFIEFYTEEHGQAPAWQWEICSHCHGHGGSTRHLGAYTQSDRDEMGDEWWDFMDDVQRGVYDQPCDECGGSGKVQQFTGPALDEWWAWETEAIEDTHTRWAESGYPQ